MKIVWCEWEIGQQSLVFANGHAAERWLRNNTVLHEMAHDSDAADFDEYYQMLVEDCLIGIEDVELIE